MTFPDSSAKVSTPSPKIALMGEDCLRTPCNAVEKGEWESTEFQELKETLLRALADFRAKHGFGRGIAAPQVFGSLRMIALNFNQGPFIIWNPEIYHRSDVKFKLWDDCMSFPDLMVRVERHESISIRCYAQRANSDVVFRLDLKHAGRALSELLQHEIDHLDAILSLDRAVDGVNDIVYRPVFEAKKDKFLAMVDDYAIEPTADAESAPTDMEKFTCIAESDYQELVVQKVNQ